MSQSLYYHFQSAHCLAKWRQILVC